MQELYWPLSNRGLFSELITYFYMRNYLRYSINRELGLAVSRRDLDYWARFGPQLDFKSSRIVNRFVYGVPSTRPERVLTRLSTRLGITTMELGLDPRSLFQDAWCGRIESRLYTPERVKKDGDELRSIIERYYINTDSDYDWSVHIRRGDKIRLGESRDLPSSYLSSQIACMASKSPQGKGLVVTDDTVFSSDVIAGLRRAGIMQEIDINPFSGRRLGHQASSFNRNTKQRKIRIVEDFLAECALMLRTKQVLLSLSSNVGRAVWMCREGRGVVSYEGSFSITG